jgi:hypothetical protein
MLRPASSACHKACHLATYGAAAHVLNPTLNHQDTKSTKHTPDISAGTIFVSLL